MRIIFDSLDLLIFQFEKCSTWILRLPSFDRCLEKMQMYIMDPNCVLCPDDDHDNNVSYDWRKHTLFILTTKFQQNTGTQC